MDVPAVGLKSLAVAVPDGVRTNDDIRREHPALYAEQEQKTLARLWTKKQEQGKQDAWSLAIEPYLADPFRGTAVRRVLPRGGRSIDLELPAAREALELAGLTVSDIDLMIVGSFLPDQLGIGNATPLAKELGTECPAWNVETACSTATVALQNACALVRMGEARNVLVVVSCTYSRVIDPADTLGWFMGDGCGAFVVGRAEDGYGYLANEVVNTGKTCGTFFYEIAQGDDGPWVKINCSEQTGAILRDTSFEYLPRCVEGAAAKAGVGVGDIDFFVFNTPTAWYADFCTRILGIDSSKTVDPHPLYGNIGPALPLVNLHHAASEGKISKDDLVLVYTIGSVSTAGATVMRWGDVALGARPSRP